MIVTSLKLGLKVELSLGNINKWLNRNSEPSTINYMRHTGINSQAGQVGLVVLLVMVVLLTMGLSIMSQTTRDVSQSRQEEEATRVFNAAEAGIENALSQDFSVITSLNSDPTGVGSSSEYQYSITPLTTSYSTTVNVGHSAEIYLNTGLSGTIQIYWGANQTCGTASGLILTVYGSSTRHLAYGCQGNGDNFDAPDSYGDSVNGISYAMRKQLTVLSTDILVRLRPVYQNSGILVISDTYALPSQGHLITSTGTNDNGTETKVIQVERGRPIAPSILDFAVFSGGSLTHN